MSDTSDRHPVDQRPASAQPTLRTLLLLDLADSTALVDSLGDQRAAELVRRHDRLARDLLRRHHGREIDKTDGFLLLFERPVQAVAFALEYQRRLKELARLERVDLAARIGIHVGEVVLWENSAEEVARGAKPVEVEGLSKPVAARLMALALPGQILMSSVAHELAARAEVELTASGRPLEWKDHGRYRLKGASDAVSVHEVGECDVAHFRTPPGNSKAQRMLPWWRRPPAIAAQAVIALALVAVSVWVVLRTEPGIAFAARDWVVVGQLVNSTSEPLLDDSLDIAFRQGLAQSRHVNVLTSQQVREALTRMKLDPNSVRVDRSVGSELAQREAARALLLPSVAESRGALRLSVEVVDPHTQATVWVASEMARGPEFLLQAMDQLIEALRNRLGESLESIESTSVPLVQATTANLEALRLYSTGMKLYDQLKYDDARRLFERAIELDPEFAMAHAGVAATYLPVGRLAEGIPPARRAAALRARLSAREVLYVDALVAWAEDPTRAVDRWLDYANMYPDAGAGQNNAALTLWQDLNRCQEAIPLFDQAFHSRDPKRFASGHGKAYCELWCGDGEVAERTFRAAMQVNSRAITRGLVDIYTYLERFDEAGSALAADAGNVAPVFQLEADARRVTWLAYQGRLGEALAAARALEVRADSMDSPGSASRARIYAAALRMHLAQPDDLRALAASELAMLDQSAAPQHSVRLHLGLLALIAQRRGDGLVAREWMARIRQLPLERHSLAVDAMLAAVDARQADDPAQALERLAPGADGHEYLQTRVAAADLAEAAADRDEALRHLRWIDEQRGRAFAENAGVFATQVLNVLDVNRALLRQIELEPDPAMRAQQAERLRQRWRNADPELKQALALAQRPPSA